VAFTLALLFVMVFAVGDCGSYLRGSKEREVLFSSVTGLKPNSAVNYAGVEIGRVRETRIVKVDAAVLKKLPPISVDNLNRLPLTYAEVEQLKALKDPAKIDAATRRLIGVAQDRPGRSMILLVLEVRRTGAGFALREDDLVRLSTTAMGDSTVEISPGSGERLPEGQALLGDGSTLFTQLSDSMREIRKLLGNVSGIIGEEERVNVQTTLANIKKASEDLCLVSAKVRGVVANAEKPVAETIKDLRAGVSDARTTVAEVRKTVQGIGPKVTSAVESGKKMFDAGRKAAESAEKLLNEVRPQLTLVLRNSSETLDEVQDLLFEVGDAMDESRPKVRRALVDLRESLHNIREASSRVRRAPWLLFRTPKRREEEIMLLESSARSLSTATQDLAVAMERLRQLAYDPKAYARFQSNAAQDLLKEVRAIYLELDKRRQKAQTTIRKLQRKRGGRYMERAREDADQEK
jgi:ABC-type transporter Mla subunit MlaD